MFKYLATCFFLFSSLTAFASENCEIQQQEIEQQLKMIEESTVIFNSEFKKVESSTLECKNVSDVIDRGNDILSRYKTVEPLVSELETSCGISIPLEDSRSEVSLRLHYVNFYRIINCDKIDI